MRSRASSHSTAEAFAPATAGILQLRSLGRGSLLAPAILGLAGLAWVALWTWGQSPYARYLDHSNFPAAICESAPLAVGAHVALYVAGWTLMVVAMMLPTTLPLMEMFRKMVAARRDRTRLLILLIAGYLACWLAYGFVAHALDRGLHFAVGWLDMPGVTPWLFGVAPFLAAGAFQFTALKYHCLDRCRSPLVFIAERWRGGGSSPILWQTFRLGIAHGTFCVGCCWVLMLLMFAVGMGNLAWMLALAVVMAAEKNLPWGHRLAAPVGVALLIAGGLIALEITLR